MDDNALLRAACEAHGWEHFEGGAVIGVPGGRRQRVFLEPFRDEGQTKGRAYTVIGEASALSATRLEAALAVNFHLEHGALALRDRELVMVETVCPDSMNAAQLAEVLSYIAARADQYERTIYGTDKH
ncbi:MAG: hypothetical protein P8Y92_08025 [Halioglobus sp.]|jgi:hypothetical protein